MRRYTWTALVLVAGAALGSALVWWGHSRVPVGEGSGASSTARNESLSAVPAPTSENESAAVPIPTPATPTRANPIDKYAERIREAQTAAVAGDWDLAIGRLGACPRDQRGWEWGYLRRLCSRRSSPADPEASLTARGASIYFGALAISIDGRRVVAGSRRDRSVSVWEPDTGVIHRLSVKGKPLLVCGVALSPDGRRVAVAHDDGVTILATETGNVMHEFRDHVGCVNAVAFSPNGLRIASGGDDRTVKVRWFDTSKPVLSLPHPGGIADVAWIPGGQRIATACGDPADRIVRIWEADNVRLLETMTGHDGAVGALTFNADGTRLASSDDKTIILWDMFTGRKVLTIHPPDAPNDRPTFSPDGMRLAAALRDQTVRIWHAETGRELLSIPGPVQFCGAVFSSDGRRLAASGRDKAVLLAWDAAPLDVD